MNPPEVHAIAAAARASRAALLATHPARQFELPLRFWRQQVHFTTPASGRPEKALSALASVPRLLARFELVGRRGRRRTWASMRRRCRPC